MTSLLRASVATSRFMRLTATPPRLPITVLLGMLRHAGWRLY
jgi:hypothetical protein